MGFRVVIVFVIILSLMVGVAGNASAHSPGDDTGTSVNLKIDATAAVLFAELMSYIRIENEDFFAGGYEVIPAEMIAVQVERNRQNSELSEMIDSLLALPVYTELSRIMKSFGPEKLEGKAAYREAFYRLPWMRTRLMGDVDDQYLQIIQKSDPVSEQRVANLAGQFSTDQFATEVRKKVTEWLPPELIVGFRDTVNVFVYFDGNRGCFYRGGTIYIDLMHPLLVDSVPDSACAKMIASTVAHELHHLIYGNWLAESAKGTDSADSWRDRALRRWRDAVLTEGTARFCDWENLPECAREMAIDQRLGKEIFSTWESVFLRLSQGDISESEYQAMMSSFEHDRALKWFKQYLTGNYHPTRAKYLLRKYPAYRPVPHYYVGYRVFNEILETGGKSAFFYAMLHPEEVLDIYRDMAAVDDQAPHVSDEIVSRWAGL